MKFLRSLGGVVGARFSADARASDRIVIVMDISPVVKVSRELIGRTAGTRERMDAQPIPGSGNRR